MVGETAKTLSERLGKVLQQRQSMTINRNDKSTFISTQMDSLIPASKISNLIQGMFVGTVSDNFDERIERKIFYEEIVVYIEKNCCRDQSLPADTHFSQSSNVLSECSYSQNGESSDGLTETIEANYKRVKQEILALVDAKIERIKNDPELAHLINIKKI